MTNGAVLLTMTNVPGAPFTVLAASGISTPVSGWSALGLMSETSPGQFQWADSTLTNRSQRFFRARSP